MASSYPTSVDSHTQVTDGVDIIQAQDVNLGYDSVDAIETFVGITGKAQTWNTDILEYLSNMKAPRCEKDTASQFTVTKGAIAIKNSGQSTRVLRRTTSDITVTASDIDTGSLANATYYYIYAVADASGTIFTVKFSLSSTSPTGLTNFELIGWFYNEQASALNITSGFIGNVKTNGRDVPNAVEINSATTATINDTSYGTDLTNAEVKIYTSGRPLLILFHGATENTPGNNLQFIVDVDGSDRTNSETSTQLASGADLATATINWIELNLAAGEHTITIQAKVSGSSDDIGKRSLEAIEI